MQFSLKEKKKNLIQTPHYSAHENKVYDLQCIFGDFQAYQTCGSFIPE